MNVNDDVNKDLKELTDNKETAKDDKAQFEVFRKSLSCYPISSCFPDFVYLENDTLLNETRFYFDIKSPHRERHVSLKGTDIETPSSFNKALLLNGGFTFDGKPIYFKKMRDRWLNNRVSEITVIPYVGYMPEIKSYVFQDFGFNQGRLYQKNIYNYLSIGKERVKTKFAGDSVPLVKKVQFRMD